MNRRRCLAAIGSTGFALFAGCSQLGGGGDGDDGNQRQGNDSGSDGANDGGGDANGGGGDGDGGGGGDDNGSAAGTGVEAPTTPTDERDLELPNESDESLETGRAPPDETGTPYENPPTVPEEEGLETGQAPNTTSE